MPCHKIWRHYGITYATYYKWKGKYGGLWASDLNHLKELEHENNRLKRMYADLFLENGALLRCHRKKFPSPLSAVRLCTPESECRASRFNRSAAP